MKLSRRDLWLVVGLGLAGLFTRWPFRSQYLYHWDSVNFALSLERYDIRLSQPQPPGYVLYSLLGRLASLAAPDANAGLVWISLLSGTLGLMAIYWLGVVMFDRQVGAIAALLALSNPLHWFYSEIALSYALEFVLVTIVAGLCYKQLTGDQRLWLGVAALLGIAGGVRQNDLVFLLPLWLVSLWPLSWGRRAISVIVLVLVVAAWLVPMVALSGGPSGYLAALRSASDGIASESSLFAPAQLGLNIARMVVYLGYGLLLGAIPLAWGAWVLARSRRAWLADRRAWVLGLWIAPAACFYIFVHLRQHGHIFTFLPAVLLLVALSTARLGQQIRQRPIGVQTRLPLASMLAAGLAVANAAFFLLAPSAPFGTNRLPLLTPSRQSIAQRDRSLGERMTYIRANFAPRDTLVLAGGLDFRHPDFYLRDYQDTALSYQLSDIATRLPDGIHTLVLFDDTVLPGLSDSAGARRVTLPSGESIRYITWSSAQHARLSRADFAIDGQ